jgi:protein-S-isoprenylcysteine O-methyltransferase Ste14
MFLLPLLVGFLLNGASAFTASFSKRLGDRRGQLLGALLRNGLGIPLWVLGLVLAVRDPSPPLFESGGMLSALAWVVILAGSLLVAWALTALGRRAAAPSAQDALVASGPYAHVRHPLYSGVLCQFAGLAILQPSLPVVLSAMLGIGWVLIQARLEELDLLRRVPGYRQYMTRVPRFVPHL